ncbi:MAG: AAA family ATPase [Elusimicrobia bacterium]|jgi:general secretion pathway protein A|nr:AAA family ATPase [Elusimicrobiota bacterium]
MSYHTLLGLKREPFSISPDPAFFYQSPGHLSALQRLEINIRMRRGLGLILGDVGTGKTTLGRVLIQAFAREPDFEFHLILNPLYQSEFQFLEALCKMFRLGGVWRSTMDCLEALETYLYQKHAVEGKTTVLLVDEGQNLSLNLIEVLRSLLNFETNEHKLLQLVVLGQLEALPRFVRIRNFMDRVNMKYLINPFDPEETRKMVRYRLSQAGLKPGQTLFTEEALSVIFDATQGYPRRVTFLCQRMLEELLLREMKWVDQALAMDVAEGEKRLMGVDS